MKTASVSRSRGEAPELLLEAARAEFEEHGFYGANSNTIAKRAGYAPQTFYRHYTDKKAIFIAVYEKWSAEERALLDGVRTAEAAAEVVIKHHQRHKRFRRALRLLTVEDADVGVARTASRKAQIARLKATFAGLAKRSDAEMFASLLLTERVSDAIADGEFAAMGISKAEAKALLVGAIRRGFGVK